MEDTGKFLIFPKPDAKFKYLAYFVFASLMRNLIPRFILDNDEKYNKIFNSIDDLKKMNYNINLCFCDLFSNFIGDMLAGVLLLIKREKTKNLLNNDGQNQKEQMKKKSFFYLSVIAIIDIIAQCCLLLFGYAIPKNSLMKNEKIKDEGLYFVVIIDIFSRYLFSRFFLESFFYDHHIVSIIITFIGFIPLIIKNLYDFIDKFNKYKAIYLILFLFMTIIYSLEDVFNKICLNQLLLRPLHLMFYKAVLQIFLVIPLSIYFLINTNLIFYIKNSIGFLRILYRISFILFNILRTWSLITIIEMVNPNHLSVLKSSEFSVLFIFLSIYNYNHDKIANDEIDIVIYLTGGFSCILSLIGSAIHNELIIINKPKLLECTEYYKEINKGTPDVEGDIKEFGSQEDNKKVNKTQDSLLDDSIE